jgi:outer membrane protein assembly factor BamA
VHYLCIQILDYFIPNKYIKFTGYAILIAVLILIISSCNPTKYVPRGESLLDEDHISINQGNVKKSDIQPYIKQKPNKKIFGARFYLGLYNLSNIKKDKWPHNWLRNIGEEPVIFDPDATEKSREQIQSYLSSKGYFDGKVSDTVKTVNRRSNVYFNIDLKPPYTVHDIKYVIDDTTIAKIVWFDSSHCMIERGKPYDEDIIQAERSRLERIIRDQGFYNFSGEHIYFTVDSTIGHREVDIYYGIRAFQVIGPGNIPTTVPHTQFKLRNIYIYPDYYPREALSGDETYRRSLDTINYNGYNFITNLKKPTIKYDVILQSLYIRPGTTFNLSATERSHNHLMALKTYRLANIFYNEPPQGQFQRNRNNILDATIQLTPMSRQSFSVELEGTNSGGNLGGALNFIYQNKNLFHGAEQFNLKLKGAYEAFSQTTAGIKSTQEFGVETSLRFPKFLVPLVQGERFIKNYNPTTAIQVAYNYQNLPVYTRTVANASFGYLWDDGPYRSHMVYPLQMNVVKIPVIDPNYYSRVIETSNYLINSYKDVMIAGGTYSYIFNNQKIKRSRHYWFIRFNAEASGNILRTIMKLSGASLKQDSLSSHYNLFGQPFAQFLRTDIDIRYNRIINDVSTVVYRAFLGIGIPYKNSVAMPFEKQYFEGGANGIRGWQVRSLGPGSYLPPSATYINQTGDIKIETNVEYRFKLFWILEGALFVDAGNIWAIKKDVDRPGAQFRINKFIDDFAVGTGFGMRFDLKFVLLRTDFGIKLRDPKYEGSSRFIFSRPGATFSDNTAIVIAIGYPF